MINKIESLTDSELNNIAIQIQKEQSRRKELQRLRRDWVEERYFKYLCHPNATAMHKDDVTVVALYSRDTGIQMATAVCLSGDKYEADVGIAVAYAKLRGEHIPDFI